MERFLRCLLLACIGLAQGHAMAQPGTDEQLATQYLQEGDNEKAALYFEKLYKQQPTSRFYVPLLKVRLALGEYDEAEKLAKDQLRRRDGDPVILVDLGVINKMQGKTDKADQYFNKALKNMQSDQGSIRQLANAFLQNNEPDRALETYTLGRKAIKGNSTDFFYETATIRAAQGDVEGMVSDYLALLASNPSYLQAVQNGLARFIDFTATDERSDILRTELLRRIQKDPQNTLFPEMLIWMYIQRKDLNSAFIQSKAMDKRFNEKGDRLMTLGDMAVVNQDWATAAKCYEYVVSVGTSAPWYAAAKTGLVEAMDAHVMERSDPPQDSLDILQSLYISTLAELGYSPANITLISGLARLKAYYLDDAPGAVNLLQNAIAMPGIERQQQARLKLEMGDIMVLQNDIWDASLLYSQVDLDFKQDVFGHEARLRNAKVSFYAGDFLWAKAQLDVLKASTSKLIANDAMELSLLITDNLGVDTNSVPLGLFANAQLLTFQHKYDAAIVLLDSINATYPQHSLGDDILFERYRIAYARHQWTAAAGYLEQVVELYPYDILVDNAMFQLGMLYEDQINDMEEAKKWYGKLLFEQSGSIFVPDARTRYRILRGDDIPNSDPKPTPLELQTP